MSKRSAKKKETALVPEVVEPVLSRRHEGVIVALIAHPKITDAARAAGVSESTVWRLMQREDFQKPYKEAQDEALNSALGSIQGAATEAVATLREIAANGKVEAARVQASKTILDYTFKVREQFGLEARIKQLEEALKAREEADKRGDEDEDE
jgi:DNA-binding MurR/RpiR family transcriptional regulator